MRVETTTRVIEGDCREILAGEAADSFDACVCDPPYDLTQASRKGSPRKRGNGPAGRHRVGEGGSGGFMGKTWDATGVAFDPATWRKVFRVLKPGAHLVAFGGTRTHHRLTCAVEDAGFEVRDALMWVYGQGFPKSLSVSKQLRSKVKKALDNLDQKGIIQAWKRHLDSTGVAEPARLLSQKRRTVIGMSMPKKNTVRVSVSGKVALEKSSVIAIIAELQSSVAHQASKVENTSSVQGNVVTRTSRSKSNVSYAEKKILSHGVELPVVYISAPVVVKDWENANTENKIKGVEALKTWLGRKTFSNEEDLDALNATLTDDLKRTILRRSKTFQNFDTIQQTACVSVMIVTTTESIMASLISSTVDTLRNRITDKVDNPEAEQWQGWGTALKPAWEPIVLARKPISEGSVAANVLRWGTGAINVGACKVGTKQIEAHGGGQNEERIFGQGKGIPAIERGANPHVGRWPANLVLAHDPRCVLVGTEADPGYAINRFRDGAKPFGGGAGHEYDSERVPGGEREFWACVPECPARMLDEQSGRSTSPTSRPRTPDGPAKAKCSLGRTGGTRVGHADSGGASRFFNTVSGRDGEPSAERTYADEGATNIAAKPGMRRAPTSASRFFYTAKSSSAERVLGCPPGFANRHPTIKPLALMCWLVRLVAPPGGVVLDPFAGSGSTLIAARLEGHDALGIDLDPESVACARGRLDAAERYGASLTRLKRVRVKRRRFKRAKNA